MKGLCHGFIAKPVRTDPLNGLSGKAATIPGPGSSWASAPSERATFCGKSRTAPGRGSERLGLELGRTGWARAARRCQLFAAIGQGPVAAKAVFKQQGPAGIP